MVELVWEEITKLFKSYKGQNDAADKRSFQKLEGMKRFLEELMKLELVIYNGISKLFKK